MRKKDVWEPLSTELSLRNTRYPEEFPEGAYGMDAVTNFSLGKETFETGGVAQSAFTYEAREFHEGMPRQMDGSHPTHDNPDDSYERPLEGDLQ